MADQVRSRVNELARPSPEFPRSFVPEEVDFSVWENLEPLFEKLLDRELDSVEALEQWLLDESEFGSVIAEEGSRRYVAMTCATDNVELEKAFLHFVENIEPYIKPISHQLDVKLLECPYVKDLDPQRYEVMLRSTKNSVELFREENIPLQTETSKLSQQYQKILGAMTVMYKGEEKTLQQMGVYQEDVDRQVRQETWELTVKRQLEDTEKLEDIFDKMLELRFQMAQNAGFDDFISYQFRRFERFDYTPGDCLKFHDSIEHIVVPMTRRLMEERKQALKIDSVFPWDTSCDKFGRPPLKPFDNTVALVKGGREIFGRVDKELGDQFQRMIDLGLLDLDSRKGKAPGGYQSSLNEVRLPFIFMNAVGVNRDVFTLLHEGGHAFHQFAVHDESLLSYRHGPMEFAEVASMSMEHLGGKHLDVFYSPGDAARARRKSLEGDVGLFPWVAIIDAFQHWIYSHPGHTRDERAEYWISLMERFGAGVDWSGYEDALKRRWHAQLHIFEYPFYYVEYAIALLGALQVWRNSRADFEGAVKAYKAALKLGGSRPLPELFKAASINFDFTEATIKPLMDEVQAEIERQGKQENR